MFNKSKCDRKSQFAEIKTDLLNSLCKYAKTLHGETMKKSAVLTVYKLDVKSLVIDLYFHQITLIFILSIEIDDCTTKKKIC